MDNAKLFFPFNEGDELQDLYEERLFADKQFFQSRAVLPSLFVKRFEKLIKRELAFRHLTDSSSPTPQFEIELKVSQDSIPVAYTDFQKNKAVLQQQLFLASDIPTLISIVEGLIKNYEAYTAPWLITKTFDTKEILISKEPEPVLLAKAIQSFNLVGGKTILDLEELTYDGKELLINEAKRLSLWRKKEYPNVSI